MLFSNCERTVKYPSVLNHNGKNQTSRIILQAKVWIQLCLEVGLTQEIVAQRPSKFKLPERLTLFI